MLLKKTIRLLAVMFFVAVISPVHAQFSIFKTNVRNDVDQDGIKNKRDKCPNTASGVAVDGNGCPMDSDKDGVADYLDNCPTVPGLSNLNGCQDKDNDGVSDFDDSCVNVPGLARFKGCPDSDEDGIEDSRDNCPNAKGLDMFNGCPDTDGDGVADTRDKCPDTKRAVKVDESGCPADSDGDGVLDADDKCAGTLLGVKVNEMGCPSDADGDGVLDANDKCPGTKMGVTVNEMGCPSDSDGDGVLDAVDKCPNVFGLAENKGCPEVKKEVPKRMQFAARKVNFQSGNASIKESSYAMLNEIVNILNEYPDYNLRISGHTDSYEKNGTTLSQSRVDATKVYLLGKGVPESRIVAAAYGKTRPVSSNANATARAQNRRVDLTLYVR